MWGIGWLGSGLRQPLRLLARVIFLMPAAALLSAASGAPPEDGGSRKLTIDDVLAIQRLDQAVLSPDGEWAALVVQRPAVKGEVYGRNAYEIDQSRSDIVLVSTRTGDRRAITNGAPEAAGFWCAAWSPDGRRLAMLSTQPEAGEPRGGDNVRLYLWDRTSGALTRASNEALPTQMRYGGPFEQLDFRGGADRGTAAHICSGGEENAPFLWLDAHRILAATLPPGETSAMLDRYTRPFRAAAADGAAVRAGQASTARVVGSGAARQEADAASNRVILKVLDVEAGAVRALAPIPTYPFRGGLTVSVSPSGKQLAVLATVGAIQPESGRTIPNASDDMWTVERRLGFVDLMKQGVRWTNLPSTGRHPLSLYEWSPDGRNVVIRARASSFDEATSLYVVPTSEGEAKQLSQPLVEENQWGPDGVLARPVLWSGPSRVVARLPGAEGRADWWLLKVNGGGTNLTKGLPAVPRSFHRAGQGQLVAFSEKEMLRLDAKRGVLETVASLEPDTSLLMPNDRGRPSDRFLLSHARAQGNDLYSLTSSGQRTPAVSVPDVEAIDFDPVHDVVVTKRSTSAGVHVGAISLADGRTSGLLDLNTHLARIAWGERRLIDYTSEDGRPLKAAVVLPPDYKPGQKYPTLLWVYQGYQSRSLDSDYFLDPMMPGIYNMYLYAAKGYAVLLPSIPWPKIEEHDAAFPKMAGNVLPAADKLISLGIADPNRLGVFGQSRGGYTVMALLTQTQRFKAGIAMAGISDLSSYFGEFDPMARGYPGIEHEKSNNWAQVSQFGRHEYPVEGRTSLAAISPLYHAEQVRTPLLMMHGDLDMRDPPTQSEQFFSALYEQGKTAQLVRFGGEGHGLAQSPANIRDIFDRSIGWFDRFVKDAK
jgi:dipeptidyl aminopeptidase/acylaminoacyl peptidase